MTRKPTRKPRPTREESIAAMFKRDVKHLKEMCPPLLPVRAYRRELKDCLGYCYMATDTRGHPSHFVIAVEKRLSAEATWNVLLHEFAHALSWAHDHETFEDHGPEWGLAYSRVYQEAVDV